MKSGAQIGAENRLSFLDWIDHRFAASDWNEYVHGGKLNKSKIALECGFARAVFAQNPAIKKEVQILENELHNKGILYPFKSSLESQIGDKEDATNNSLNRRDLSIQSKSDSRLKALEEQNAALKAEVRELRRKLADFKHLDDNLMKTGRLLHP